MRKLFGTDGIRGVANVDPMTTEMAMQLGRGVAYIFKNHEKRHRIVIGKDTRLSGYMLENALAAGICSMGVDVLLVGPSGTESLIRVMVEGENEKEITAFAEQIADCIRKKMEA